MKIAPTAGFARQRQFAALLHGDGSSQERIFRRSMNGNVESSGLRESDSVVGAASVQTGVVGVQRLDLQRSVGDETESGRVGDDGSSLVEPIDHRRWIPAHHAVHGHSISAFKRPMTAAKRQDDRLFFGTPFEIGASRDAFAVVTTTVFRRFAIEVIDRFRDDDVVGGSLAGAGFASTSVFLEAVTASQLAADEQRTNVRLGDDGGFVASQLTLRFRVKSIFISTTARVVEAITHAGLRVPKPFDLSFFARTRFFGERTNAAGADN